MLYTVKRQKGRHKLHYLLICHISFYLNNVNQMKCHLLEVPFSSESVLKSNHLKEFFSVSADSLLVLSDHLLPGTFYQKYLYQILLRNYEVNLTCCPFCCMNSSVQHGHYILVRHFNYTSWPEHGVPESCSTLIKFVKAVRGHRHDNTTIVVHCRY